MREIKFRGYSKQELTTPTQWIDNAFGVTTIEYTDNTESTHLITPYGDYNVHKESVGQYTGLKDKNGKEIFEGDILGCKTLKLGIVELGIVKFEQGCYLCGINFLFNICNDYEVVGNIYEEGTIK